MKKSLRRVLSFLLVIAMSAGLLSVTTAAEEKKPKYVALGDSYSQAFMFHDYGNTSASGFGCCTPDSYVTRFAEYLGADLVDLTIRGMRPVELYKLFMPDDAKITDWDIEEHFRTWKRIPQFKIEPDPMAAMAKYYRDAVKDADVITFDLGMSEFGIFGMETLSKLMSGESVEIPSAAEYISCLDKDAYEFIELLRTNLHGVLDSAVPDLPVADAMEAFVYACTSFIVNFNNCIDYITTVNPNAELIVLSLFNPNKDLSVMIDGVDSPISFSAVLDILYDSLNLHVSSICRYASLYKFAYYDNIMPIFADELHYFDAAHCSDELRYNIAKKVIDLIGTDKLTELLNEINGDNAILSPVTAMDVYDAYTADEPDETQTAITAAFDKALAVFEKAVNNRVIQAANITSLGLVQAGDDERLYSLLKSAPEALSDADCNFIYLITLFSTDNRGSMTHPAPAAMDEKYDAVVKAHESKFSANGTLLRVVIDTATKYNKGLGALVSGLIDRIFFKERIFFEKLTTFFHAIFSFFGRITALTPTVG